VAEADRVSSVVLVSRAAVLLAIVALVAMFSRNLLVEVWPWIGIVATVGLGHPLIVKIVRDAEPHARARALRRANLLVTPALAVVVLPLASLIAATPISAWPLLASSAGIFALIGAAFGDLARFALPETWHDVDRPRGLRSFSRRTHLVIAASWLPVSALLFWLLTGLTGDGGCVVDGNCSFGVPFRFANFGERSGWKLNWGHFWRDVGVVFSLIPAVHGLLTSRLRVIFGIYLLFALVMLFANAEWGDDSSMRVWMQVDLLGR
jgi:hypothetical protein